MDMISTNEAQKEANGVRKRYFVDFAKMNIPKIQLSVLRDQLPDQLKEIKRSLSLTLIQFERAPVVMQPYKREHIFETLDFISDDVVLVKYFQ